MKHLSFFISLLCIFTAFETSTRSVNITAPNGSTLYIDDSITAAQLFRECRNYGFCDSSRRLVVYFGNREIIENSEASNRPLYYFANYIDYATVSYYHQSSNYYTNPTYDSYYNYDYRTISIRAPNGSIATVRTNQTPAAFFRSCRSAGYCSSIAPMTLKFGHYEIREDSAAANKYFYEFNTDATYAYVMYWNYQYGDNSLADALLSGALIGAVISGITWICS